MVARLDAVLARCSFFDGMEPGALALIAGCGSNVGFEAGETLVREGEPADTFFVVRQGTVAVELHAPPRGRLTIDTIEEGEVLGWSWLFPPHRWSFDARAVTGVRATVFDGACLRRKCDADPALGYELMKRFARVFSDRLASTRLRLLDVYGSGG
jgi:CRP-like cAMP-binding protein